MLRTLQLYQIAKVDFSFLSNDSPKQKVQTININIVFQDEFIKILHISEPPARKIITLRDSLNGGFNEPKDLLQLSELTNLDWQECEKEGIIFSVE